VEAGLWPFAGLIVKATCPERREFAIICAMKSEDDPRKARLAQALRDNLRRRKAQAREERAIEPDKDRVEE
jgi:hypothetical protein